MSDGAGLARRWPWTVLRRIAADFTMQFAVVMFGLVLVLQLGTIIDTLRGLLKYNPSMWLVLAYYACRAPYNVIAAAPLAALIATLMTLSMMLRSHELVALRAGGVSQYAIAAPILAVSLVCSLMTYVFSESVYPEGERMAREIKWVRIRGVPLAEWRVTQKAAIWTSGGALVFAREANGEEEVLKGVSIFEFRGGEITARIDAETARPVKGMWELAKAQSYRWRSGRPVLERAARATYPMLEGIADFVKEDVPMESLTRGDLRILIERLKRAGKEYGAEQVFYYFKMAFPFASFIVALLGLGVSFTFQANPRSGVAASFGVAFFSALGYMFLVQVGQVLGVGGVLHPIIAVWMANAVFLIAGLVLLWKAWVW